MNINPQKNGLLPVRSFAFLASSRQKLVVAVVFPVLAAIGCSTVQPDTVTKFSQGLTQSQQQADVAFHGANALAREESIRYVMATTRPGFKESDFNPALSADAIKEFDSAFSAMQAYASSLQTLLSGDQAADFGKATTGLASELKTGTVGAKISPGVATAFAQLGEDLITLKAEHDAKKAMLKADPDIHLILTQMADALGKNDQDGIRGTVYSNWTTQLAQGPQTDYAAAVADNNNMDKKRAAIDAYLSMLDQRDAQLASLASVRQSLLMLAAAHTASAAGSQEDVAGIISLIGTQLADTKTLFQQFSTIENTGQSTAKAKTKTKTKPTTRSSNE